MQYQGCGRDRDWTSTARILLAKEFLLIQNRGISFCNSQTALQPYILDESARNSAPDVGIKVYRPKECCHVIYFVQRPLQVVLKHDFLENIMISGLWIRFIDLGVLLPEILHITRSYKKDLA